MRPVVGKVPPPPPIDCTSAEWVLATGTVFAFDSAVLASQTKTALRACAVRVQRHLEDPRARVSITGFADGIGRAAYNLRLSDSRAHAVASELEAGGVDPSRLTVAGLGELGAIDGVADPSHRVVVVVLS